LARPDFSTSGHSRTYKAGVTALARPTFVFPLRGDRLSDAPASWKMMFDESCTHARQICIAAAPGGLFALED
jgi:hypothetical protein